MTGLYYRFRRLYALIRKESLQIVRDPGTIIITIILPLILVFLLGYGVSLDAEDVHIGLVVEEPTPVTERLADGFRGSRYFSVREGTDRRHFEDDMVNGHLRGIVVIPADFTRRITERRGASIQVLVDGTDPITAKFVQNYAQGVVSSWSAMLEADLKRNFTAISIKQRYWFNAELTSKYSIVPGAIALVMTIVGTLLTSLVIAREWERGTMEAIMATPVSSGELLLGKFIPYFLLGLVSMTICLLLAMLMFHLPLRGSLVALYALSCAFLLPSMGIGLLISAVAKNQFIASQVGIIVGFLPTFLLSGFVFEINSMPLAIRMITTIVPARYMIPSLQSVFLAGDLWRMFLPAMGVLVGMGALLLVAVIRKTRKRIE